MPLSATAIWIAGRVVLPAVAQAVLAVRPGIANRAKALGLPIAVLDGEGAVHARAAASARGAGVFARRPTRFIGVAGTRRSSALTSERAGARFGPGRTARPSSTDRRVPTLTSSAGVTGAAGRSGLA